ncbi:MAG: response regulator transcription factor [Chloroflexota bacterium]|nr:response regulator transcription factor [Chloroflexota bacterium]
MENKINVTILDDHQSIVDGYLFRLSKVPQIEIVATLEYGEDLEATLKKQVPDVLILDVNVKVSAENSNNYPIFHVIPDLLQRYPDLAILVISMHNDRSIIRAVMEGGASGYILKDDQKTIRELGSVILSIVSGGIYLSEKVRNLYVKNRSAASEEPLTGRQMEALSLCAAYPDHTTERLAQIMNVANSTVRNLLSGAYLRLGVNSRAAAIAKARQLGLIPPDSPPLPMQL